MMGLVVNDSRTRRERGSLRDMLGRCILAATVALAALNGTSERVLADPLDAQLRQGVQLRRHGRDEEALEVFRRAHAESPSPRTSAQMALAAQALGYWVEAEAGLLEALQSSSDPWIARNREVLRAALERVQRELGTLTIETDAPNASIRVGGVAVGNAPLAKALRVKAGTVSVDVIVNEQTVATQEVLVPARAEIVVMLATRMDVPRSLAAAAPSTLATPGDILPAAAASNDPPSPTPTLHGHAARSASNGRAEHAVLAHTGELALRDTNAPPRWLGWTLAATGGGLLASGIVAHVVRENSAAHYNDDARCFHGDQTRDQRCGHVRDTFETAQSVAIVSYGLSAAALGGALTLLLWPEPERGGHVACIGTRLSDRAAYVSAAVIF